MQYAKSSINSGKALYSSSPFNKPSHEESRYSVGQESQSLPVTDKQNKLEAENDEESVELQMEENEDEHKLMIIAALQKRPINKINIGEPPYSPQFGRPFDEKRYQRVLKDVCLVNDIRELSIGDFTEVR